MVGQERWAGGAGGVACPAPMTRVALLNLRNSGGLSTSCHYTITDHVQGRLVAGTTITLHAAAANELAENAIVNTTYDNEGWSGRYDIDTGLVQELSDNRNNRVVGATSVGAFDWGNTAYLECTVENATWNATIGSTIGMIRVRLLDGAVLTTTGMTGGGIQNTTIGPVASLNLTNSNLLVRESSIRNGGSVNATGYVAGGTGIYRADIADNASVTLGAGSGVVSIQATRIGEAAVITHTGAGAFTLNNSSVYGAANITHGSPLACSMSGCSIFGAATNIAHTAGSLSMTGSVIGPYGRVIKNNAASTGALTINYSVIDTTGYVQQDGAGAMSMTGTNIRSTAFARTLAGSNVPSFTLNYSNLQDSSYVSINAAATAGSVSINYTTLTSNSFIDKSGTGVLNVTNSMLSGYGRIQLSGVRSLNVNTSFLTNTGRVLSGAAGGAGITDIFQFSSCQDYGVIHFNATGAAANQILYSSVRGNTGNITFSGTNRGTVVSRMTVDNGNVTFANNTVAFPTIIDIGVRDQGTLNVSGCTAAQDIRYSTVQSYGRWNITNKSVAAQNFGVDVSANGTFTSRDAAGNCYYVAVRHGTINHNGGVLTTAIKEMSGTLTTGAFNHTNIQHRVNGSKTLTVANTSRADYQGLAAQLV
jgi:hypothetical protein